MDEDKQKILYAVGFVGITLVLGFLLYWVFFRPAPVQVPVREEPDDIVVPRLPKVEEADIPTEPLPDEIVEPEPIDEPEPVVVEESEITIVDRIELDVGEVASGGQTRVNTVTADIFNAPAVNSASGDIYSYSPIMGSFLKVDEAGNTDFVSDKQFYNVEEVAWSPNGDSAIMEFGDGTNLYYDFDQDVAVRLPDQISEPRFNESGDKIAFEWYDEIDYDRNYIGVSNPDGTGVRFVELLGDVGDRVHIEWSPESEYIATVRNSKNGNAQELTFIGQNGENYKKLSVPGANVEYDYVPNSSKMLISSINMASGGVHELYIANADQDNFGSIVSTGLKTTIHKCAMNDSGTAAYCAVPRIVTKGSALVPQLSSGSPEDFYEVDLATGESALIAVPEHDELAGIVVKDVMLSSDQKTLFFTNQTDGRLLSLQLE